MKKKQHYVWKKYLTPWSINGQIWTKRGKKTFLTSLENIAQKNYFYETFTLKETENQIINAFIKKSHPSSYSTLFEAFNIFQNIALGDEETRKTGIEEYYALVEGRAIKFLNLIYEKNYSFLMNEKLRAEFSYFVGVQYMRTKRNFDNVVEVFQKGQKFENNRKLPRDLNIESLAKALLFLSSDHIGNWLSQTNIAFFSIQKKKLITSDQPVINLSAEPNDITQVPNEMKLYCPFSPEIAMFAGQTPFDNYVLTDNEVERLNEKVRNFSHELVFALKEHELS